MTLVAKIIADGCFFKQRSSIREPWFTFVCSSELPLCSRDEPVFVAWCTPLAMPENREIVVQGATNVFTTVHSLDMKIIEVDDK